MVPVLTMVSPFRYAAVQHTEKVIPSFFASGTPNELSELGLFLFSAAIAQAPIQFFNKYNQTQPHRPPRRATGIPCLCKLSIF